MRVQESTNSHGCRSSSSLPGRLPMAQLPRPTLPGPSLPPLRRSRVSVLCVSMSLPRPTKQGSEAPATFNLWAALTSGTHRLMLLWSAQDLPTWPVVPTAVPPATFQKNQRPAQLDRT